MTSSLVGSEMCIRDRAVKQNGPCVEDAGPNCYYQDPRGPRKNEVKRFEPVSYTHLTLPTICSV
eukprot:9173446-Prorocentrum_lima.AAC.1